MADSKNHDELFVDSTFVLSDDISMTEIMLLETHLSELLKDVLIRVQQGKE